MNANVNYYLYRGFWIGLDWLFPPICGGCGNTGIRWCDECQQKVQEITGYICKVCGLPQDYLGLCKRCMQSFPAFKELRSWAVFEQPVQGALHRLKYRRDVGLGEALARQMIGYVKKSSWPVDMVIPIQLGKKSLKERGYNQVGMVAKPLTMRMGIDYSPNALIRSRETRSQVGRSAGEHQKNVQDAFVAARAKVKDRTILLVDDVSTTGATLSSAADALRQYGAMEVYALTVARALPHHRLKVV